MLFPKSQDDSAAPPEQKGVRAFLSRGNWLVYGGVLLALLTLHIAYRCGYKVGYGAAMGPEGKHITTVYQIASAEDETLLDMARRRTELFSWIKDDAVRREVWSLLLHALVERQLVGQVDDAMLAELLPPDKAHASDRRLWHAAWGLACAGKWSKAKAYFKEAQESLAAGGQSTEELLRSEMLAAGKAGLPRAELMQEWEELLPLAKKAYPGLYVELEVYIAQLCGEQGLPEKAAEHYRAAAEVQGLEQDKVAANVAVCYGFALYEVGQRDAAVEWLSRALARPGEGSEAFADIRVMALRHLATISLEEDRPVEALAYLNRAEGEAFGRIAPGSVFWLFLHDQRGWAHYSMHMYEEALADFDRGLQAAEAHEESLRAQLLEGRARCYLALGRSEEALQDAAATVQLRERCLAQDKEPLGRACLVLAQAQDQAGRVEEAAESYGRAATLFPEESAARPEALRGRAFALMQLRRWEPAAAAWEELLSLLPRGAYARREEAQDRLNICRRNLPEAAKPQPAPTTSLSSSHRHRPASASTRRAR